MDTIQINNIFAAVSNKKMLDGLLAVVNQNDVKFWGTLGTATYLEEKGYKAMSVVRGFDFDGRVKTLSRPVFSSILADRSKPEHLKELAMQNITMMDLVIVDLYPPDKTIFPESMDIGGQSLIRSACKNYKNIALAYDEVSMAELVENLNQNSNSTTLEFRKKQSAAALKFIAQRCQLEAQMFEEI